MVISERERSILLWVPVGQNTVTLTVDTFHTVEVNSERGIQIPIVSDDCHFGNEEPLNDIISDEITIWEYYRCLVDGNSTCITSCLAQTNEEISLSVEIQ